MAQTTKGTERTLGQLVADASADLKTIVKDEIALAKVEIKADVAKGGKGAGLLAGAGLFGLYLLGFLLLTLAWGLHAAGLQLWIGLLVTSGLLLVITLILALLGIKALRKVRGKPARTIDNAQRTVAAIKPPKV